MDERAVRSERKTAIVFGLWSLFAWAASGMVLDVLHALRVSAFLDQPLRRELLTWGHAHGVGLSLVVLAYAAVGVSPRANHAGRLLRAAAVLMPIGFSSAVVGHGESDPGPSIVLVPVGALCFLFGLFRIAFAATVDVREA